MKKIRLYLDEAKDRGIVRNDSELAQKLGLTRSNICDWRNGRSAPGEEQAAALAALLGKPEIMAEAMAARAKSEDARKMWERAARALAVSTTFCLIMSALLYPADSHESETHKNNSICIM
jgi:transcriptional regulator with XRE-family HTH domain